MSVRRLTSKLLLVLGMSACSSPASSFVIEYVGVSGVVRSGPEAFSLVLYPCDDTLISRVELWVRSVDADGVDHAVKRILTATYDPPVSARRVLVSTGFDYVPEDGVVRVVDDEEALRRFNTDRSYMTTINLDAYLGWSAWDGQGQSIAAGDALDRRFEAGVGEVVLADYLGPLGAVVCFDGSRAWTESP